MKGVNRIRASGKKSDRKVPLSDVIASQSAVLDCDLAFGVLNANCRLSLEDAVLLLIGAELRYDAEPKLADVIAYATGAAARAKCRLVLRDRHPLCRRCWPGAEFQLAALAFQRQDSGSGSCFEPRQLAVYEAEAAAHLRAFYREQLMDWSHKLAGVRPPMRDPSNAHRTLPGKKIPHLARGPRRYSTFAVYSLPGFEKTRLNLVQFLKSLPGETICPDAARNGHVTPFYAKLWS